jgi:hypothetical protein
MPVMVVFEKPFFSSADKKPLMMLSLRFVPFGLLGLYNCIVTVYQPYCLREPGPLLLAHLLPLRCGRRFLADFSQR